MDMQIPHSGTVLLIDSDPEVSQLMQKWFLKKGIALVYFKSAQDAIYEMTSEACRIDDVSLIIVDMFLSGPLNGKELVDILHSKFPDAHAIIVVNRPILIDTEAVSKQTGVQYVFPEQASELLNTIV